MNTIIPNIPCRHGKVRDIYDLGDRLVLIATDRISAFDCILPTLIPDKGRILTQLTSFWFDFLKVPHHLLSTNLADMGPEFDLQSTELLDRACLVRKTNVIPVECVVRGYLTGSLWKEYQANHTTLPPSLGQAEKLESPIFTPTTKEDTHDIPITFDQMTSLIGISLAEDLRWRSIEVYEKASAYAASRGILLADTKLEWGLLDNQVILIDEVLTPDSSRFWPTTSYEVGTNPPSLDKQYVRDWLEANWDMNSTPPVLPQEVVEKTRQKYLDIYKQLTGREL